MSGRALLRLANSRIRERAHHLINIAQDGTFVEFRAPTRSLEQNAKMWALLTNISQQVVWYGQKLTAEDWKDVFTASYRRSHVVPGIDQGTFVPLGMRTSTMTKRELSDILEIIQAFGAERGVEFQTDMFL